MMRRTVMTVMVMRRTSLGWRAGVTSTSCVVIATVQALLLVQVVGAQLPITSSDIAKPPCDSSCSPSDRDRPVCGTDGRTYSSRCELQTARCQGHTVAIQHRGKCAEDGQCRTQRALAQQQAKDKDTDVFIPECKDDGSYAEVQCHSYTGYCWCVDKSGTPIRGSSTHHKRPNCSQKGRRTSTSKRQSSSKKQNRRLGCSVEDRSAFNTNLIDIFRSEYNRIPASTTTTQVPNDERYLDSEERRIIQWKFTQLDKNGDDELQRREIRDLRRMVKKIVKPRPCAKLFAKQCDTDADKVITREEWALCLGVDSEQVNSKRVREDPHATLAARGGTVWSDSMPGLNGGDSKQDTSAEVKDEVELQDCATAQRIAMENHRQDPSGGIFIPECTIDGLYQEAQCHKSAGFCWCVNPKTGRPIRGTTTNHVKPNCEEAKKSARAFKGCSLKKKEKFLSELIDSFSDEMREAIANASRIMFSDPTAEEITKWKFSRLDGNGNKILDRKEWRDFRKEWKGFRSDGKSFKKLRKCWRNFLRFCDANGDKRVTPDEWLDCTGVKRESRNLPPLNPKRRGPNPFSTILKSD